jgi:hypothetical protein
LPYGRTTIALVALAVATVAVAGVIIGPEGEDPGSAPSPVTQSTVTSKTETAPKLLKSPERQELEEVPSSKQTTEAHGHTERGGTAAARSHDPTSVEGQTDLESTPRPQPDVSTEPSKGSSDSERVERPPAADSPPSSGGTDAPG